MYEGIGAMNDRHIPSYTIGYLCLPSFAAGYWSDDGQIAPTLKLSSKSFRTVSCL
jgi:hypothetical protein